MTVKMGGPMPPMGGMPMNNPMMPRQPMNPLPPPMPVPPIVPPQAAGTFPVNKDKRKRFGDSLETMLASRRPPVASDQMANMNVFTGQMMNTAARPPVVQMRRGGSTMDMYRQAYSSPEFKAAQSAASQRNPGRTGSMTHSDLMSSIRGGSSPSDDRPAPVKMSFGDEDYTPTSAELNEAMKDMAAIGMPDLRRDQSPVVMPVVPDTRDQLQQIMNDAQAGAAMERRFNNPLSPDSGTILAPGTGGLSSVPSIPSGTSIPDELSFQTPFTNTPQVPLNVPNIFNSPFDAAENLRDEMKLRNLEMGEILKLPDELMTEPFNNVTSADPIYVGSGANPLTAYGPTSSDAFLGTGDPLDLGIGEELVRPKIRPEGGGQGETGSGEEDDRGIVQKIIDDFAAVPGNIMRDLRMGIDAGFYTDFEVARKKLMDTGKYTKAEVDSWVQRTKDTAKENQRKMSEQQGRDDDDSPMSTSPVDPCPAGMRLDPVAGICVPVEEGEDEGPSLDLNRTRDDEFSELDDLMGKIVKPVGEDVKTMQAGGSVGLNRAADNFLAAMGA